MKTLVVNFPVLKTGGIEDICYGLMKYSVQQGYRVIWLCRDPITIAESYKEFVFAQVELIHANRLLTGKWRHGFITFRREEEVTILSFTPFDMDNALKLREEFPEADMTPLYIVANTKGRFYFIEEYYFGSLRRWIFNRIKPLMQNWVDLNVVRFCSKLQIDSFEKHYSLSVSDAEHKIIKYLFAPTPLDKEQLQRKAKRNQFHLVTISRFDFPHKNYLLGLIKDYGKLKEKYTNLFLHIIGYGPGIDLVNREVARLSTVAQKDITFYGEVSKERFPELMREMHLNISVAGSVGVGAFQGVLSIPARNFCGDQCEVYGYLPESADMTTSTAEGEWALPYIEEVINMSEADYIQKCEESYKTYASMEVDPEYVFRQRANERILFKEMHRFMDRIYVFRDIVHKFGTFLQKE